MRKIIAAFDGSNVSVSTIDFTIYLAKTMSAMVSGVFLADMLPEGSRLIKVGESIDKNQPDVPRSDKVTSLEHHCRTAHVPYVAQHDYYIAIDELVYESIYADLVVINIADLHHYSHLYPKTFISQLFAEVQCPLFIAPTHYSPLQKVILLYDGSPSATHAIKMFQLLHEGMGSVETEVLTVREPIGDTHYSNTRLMKEFIKRQYPSANYIGLNGAPAEAIGEYLKKQKDDVLVVMGSTQHNIVQGWFRPGLASSLIQDIKLPLYVAFSR
jgi:hypothetical protein